MKKPISKRVLGLLNAPVPFFAVLTLCAFSGFIGRHTVKLANPTIAESTAVPKYVVAEKSAVILKSVLSHPNETGEELQNRITGPVISVLSKYANQGYIVLDAARDENNNYVVAALPEGTRNITNELAAAIDAAEVPAKKTEEGTSAK